MGKGKMIPTYQSMYYGTGKMTPKWPSGKKQKKAK